MQHHAALAVALLFLFGLCVANNANNSTVTPKRVVFFAVPGFIGHASSLVALASELSNRQLADGTPLEITFVNSASVKKILKNPKVKFVEVPEIMGVSAEDRENWGKKKFPKLFAAGWRFMSQTCYESYESFYGVVKQMVDEGNKPDLIISEQLTPTAWAVAHTFGIPYQRIYNSFYMWASPRTVQPFGEILNVFVRILSSAILHYRIHPLQEKLGIPKTTYNQFIGYEAGVTFSPIVNGMDKPMQLPLNMVQVGPMIQVDNLNLDDSLNEWFQALDNKEPESLREVIYIGFGTAHEAEEAMLNKIALAAASVPYSIVWSLRDKQRAKLTAPIPSNLKIVPWVNQHAMLNHPKVKLFVSHCGFNGLSESLYFGKPVICIPLGAEQPQNAAKAEEMGYGKHLNKDTFTEQQLSQAIADSLTSTEMRQKLEKIKKLISLAGGVQRAADHVLTYFETGTEHMIPADRALNWFQRWSVDFFAVIAFLLFLMYAIMRCTCRCCCRRSAKPKQH